MSLNLINAISRTTSGEIAEVALFIAYFGESLNSIRSSCTKIKLTQQREL